jgi:ATP-dependent helicase/nuclease subunit B
MKLHAMAHMLYHDILQNLQPGDVVLTPNKRLSRALHKAYYAQQGKSVCAAPHMVPFDAWVAELTSTLSLYTPQPEIIDTALATHFWQAEVERQGEGALLNVPQTAKSAFEGYRRLHQTRLDRSALKPWATHQDIAAFTTWATGFEKVLTQQRLMTLERAQSVLIENLEILKPHLPGRIVFIGFDQFTPLQTAFFNAFEQHGVVRVDEALPKAPVHHPKQFVANDALAQRTAALEWAKARALQNPGQHCVIVVPDLHETRNAWVRAAVCMLGELPFEMSGGEPLFQVPVVQGALQLLRLTRWTDIETASAVARLVYAGAPFTDAFTREQLDVSLREQGGKRINVEQLHGSIYSEKMPPALKQGTLQGWVSHWRAVLQSWNWPGERVLSSYEHQAMQQFYAVLQSGLALEKRLGMFSRRDALRWLSDQLRNTVFQAEAPAQVSVSVMGLIESLGLPCDSLWITGMDVHTLPARAELHPFLPAALQLEHNMAHVSSEHEMALATRYWQRLSAQSHEWIASFASLQDGVENSPSALLQGGTETYDAPQATLNAHTYPDVPLDAEPIPVPQDQLSSLKHGSHILSSQAQCAFQAFASHRLNAREYPGIETTLTAWMRGNILHEVLEQFWQGTQNHAALCELNDADLSARVKPLSEQSVQAWQKRYPLFFEAPVAAVEAARLTELVTRWLELEKTRDAFSVVSIEAKVLGEVGGIPLYLRLDRVDALEDGTKLVIDYKTGRIQETALLQEPLRDVQLPLYAHLTDAAGVAYAIIRADDVSFRGLSQNEIEAMKVIGRKPPEWGELNAQWKAQLDNIAADFVAGKADVAPVSPTVCRVCGFARLCRVGC